MNRIEKDTIGDVVSVVMFVVLWTVIISEFIK